MKKIFVVLLALVAFNVDFSFAGKSYSSGRSSSFSGSRSSGSSFKSSSSGRSYSSGSRSSSSPSKSYSSSKSSPSKSYSSPKSSPSKSSPSNSSPSKSYSSGKSSPSPSSKYSSGSYTPSYKPNLNSNSSKPTSSSFNSAMSASAKQSESQIRFEKSNPKPTYKSPTGQVKDIKPDSKPVQVVRTYVTPERYSSYNNRCSSFYGGFYSHPVYYNDSFSPFLFGWILSDAMNSQQRAYWMYHHQSEMDSARYAAILAKDAKLQAEIDLLKSQNIPVDPGYIPPQMKDNPDIMYNKEFIDASYNPVATQESLAVATDLTPSSPMSAEEANSFVSFFLTFVVVLSIVGFAIWILFVREFA